MVREKTENNKQTKMKLLTTERRLAKRRRKNEKRRQITQKGNTLKHSGASRTQHANK
jgi:hypothetical protein